MRDGPIDLHFDDPISDAGARVSMASWKIWLWIAGSLTLLWLLAGIRALHGLKINANELAGSAAKVLKNHKPPVALDPN
jgi:hypothetical protein